MVFLIILNFLKINTNFLKEDTGIQNIKSKSLYVHNIKLLNKDLLT
jgi:hypothetical protein